MSRDGVSSIAAGATQAVLRIGARDVALTNLAKPFFAPTPSAAAIAKRGLLQYYEDAAPWLLPHLAGRAMVMKRYPGGATAPFFFMKRRPPGAPAWLATCRIDHGGGNVIDFPIVDDLAALLYVVNLGCIDLNPWYARCDDVDRPDVLYFDLDPVKHASGTTPFSAVREAALALRAGLEEIGLTPYAKTSGSSGIHVYVPIERGPVQHDVWRFAKGFAVAAALRHPELLTAEYAIAKRPAGRVLVDYNQNAWGRTLASVYSVRPTPAASVSMPVSWEEVAAGVEIADFRIGNAVARLQTAGDGFAALLSGARPRVDLARFLG